MGWLGPVRQLWKGRPSLPGLIPYTEDPTIGGIRQRATGADEAVYGALMRYLQKEPGFSQEELRGIYETPAEQSKIDESEALARLNRGSSFRGSYSSGKTQAGRGQIMAEGMRTRAGLQQSSRLYAAQAALEDRLNQLRAGEQYTIPRLGMGLQETQSRNVYNQGINQQNFERWAAAVGLHEEDKKKAFEIIKTIVSMIMGGGMGGAGAGMGGATGFNIGGGMMGV